MGTPEPSIEPSRDVAELPRHAFDDHTGDVRLRVEAPTLPGLFEEAARGLAELMLERAMELGLNGAERVSLRAPDREALLVDWLNELIFLSETRQRIYTDVTVHRASDTELVATVRGVLPEALRTAVKAATLHDLRVVEAQGGYSATVVLDV
jgi:SHS2 domain-containing protein